MLPRGSALAIVLAGIFAPTVQAQQSFGARSYDENGRANHQRIVRLGV
jgi:hypothetical protein